LDWYRRYEKKPDVKAAAEKLEAVYASNDLAKEFQPLVPSIEDWREGRPRGRQGQGTLEGGGLARD
jgi:hypothetical protein